MYTRKPGFYQMYMKLMKHQMYTRKPGFNETSNVYSKNLVLMKLKCILKNLVLMKHQMYTRKPGFNETSNVYSKTWFYENETSNVT